MASKGWFITPPEGYITKKYAAWLRAKGATINGKTPRATRRDKGLKRKKEL